MEFLRTLNRKLNQALAVLAGVAMVLLMFTMVLNMVMRYFHEPVTGTYDYVTWFGIFTITYALGFTQLDNSHIKIDFFVEFFPERVEKACLAVVAWLSALFFGLLSWWMLDLAGEIMASGSGSRTLGVKEYPFAYAMVLGCLTMTLALAVDALIRSRVALFGPEESTDRD